MRFFPDLEKLVSRRRFFPDLEKTSLQETVFFRTLFSDIVSGIAFVPATVIMGRRIDIVTGGRRGLKTPIVSSVPFGESP